MSTVIEETFCDKCGTELEAGQVGKCEDCRTYPFSELSDSAKQHARETYTSGEYPYDDWWDNTYEDAVRMGKLLGIDIGTKGVKLISGKTRCDPDISFSGFSSQGDGACFEGSYWFNPKAVEEINAETNDKELIRIAEQLTLLQVTRRMLGLEPFSATIKTSGRYSHSGTMDVAVGYDVDEDGETVYDDGLESEVTQLMRDFADWIYKQLEAENDYLMSDECVDQYLEDEVFGVDGTVVG